MTERDAVTRNYDDKWFADRFIEISEDLGQIKAENEAQSKATARAFKKLESHGRRIRALEDCAMVEKERTKWESAKPWVVGGTAGSGGLVTVAGIIYAVGRLAGWW